ncbi:hypothetical protein ACIA8C_00975 [Nocardia sp. NPDC051321]|uniref:hypothetical protein n=1 Tax=Nocardia sp. NPDC051321 TaxID=3364323 RepID=UPI0037B69993
MDMVGPLDLSQPLFINLTAAHRLTIGSSVIGGIAETREMLDFCATHGIKRLLPAHGRSDQM